MTNLTINASPQFTQNECLPSKPQKANIKDESLSGFSLVEIIVVLIIIGILTGVVFGVYARTSSQSDASKMQTDLQTIVQGVRSMYANQQDGYQSLTMATLVGAKIFPSDLQYRSDGTISNQFGNTVVVAPSTNSNQNYFDVTYNGVPAEVCNKLLGSLNKESFSGITVGSTAIYDDGTSGASEIQWPTANQIQQACGSSPVAITFIAR